MGGGGSAEEGAIVNAYHRRVGLVYRLAEQHDPDVTTSRARQIARTWRSCLAYRLAIAMGWS